ncbi:MAG: hypothetical protein Q8N53_01830 [Longimicrobiales bacterium]|nr:hypothetical protein [Longimicrobiales bacterium]
MIRPWRTLGSILAAALVVGAAPGPARAQAPDFLFRVPRLSLGFRGGYALASASSEIFDFARKEMTMGRSDFDAPSFGGQLAIQITPRVDVAFDVSVASTRSTSELRDWVDTDDLPIEQVTKFHRVPVTLGFKAYLKDRGRSVGRFAWIPARWTPYVGAAGGWVWYRFEQDGDFVDFETLDIFTDRFTSRGKAPTMHVYGGGDWSLSPTVFLTAEARYGWARTEMGGDFVDFDPMDLSGLQATVGLSLRF